MNVLLAVSYVFAQKLQSSWIYCSLFKLLDQLHESYVCPGSCGVRIYSMKRSELKFGRSWMLNLSVSTKQPIRSHNGRISKVSPFLIFLPLHYMIDAFFLRFTYLLVSLEIYSCCSCLHFFVLKSFCYIYQLFV